MGEMQVVAAASMASEAEMVGEAGGGVRKRKKTLGRRKIEIKPIKCMEAKHVCFSKRREGLYKKASELCALTGAKVAVIVFSPAGKPYSFGHPSVGAVVERYLDPGSAADADAFEAPPPLQYEFDGQRERLLEDIAAEARRKDALDAAARAAGVWTDDVVRKAEMPDLVAMLAALERVRDEAADATQHAIRQQCTAEAAAAAGACDACYYDLGDGVFTANGYGGASSSHHQQAAAMETHMALLMGGNGVSHAAHAQPPFGAMLLPPPDLAPPAAPLAFNYGSEHIQITGYEGYAYELGDGGGHGVDYEMGGWYSRAMATCNFFG